MKRIATFIGLKVVEIGGSFATWYLMCVVGQRIDVWLGDKIFPVPFWACGLWAVIAIFVIILLGVLGYEFSRANWKWAGKLTNKK